MEMELTLVPDGAAEPEGTVIWDPDSGRLSGPMVEEVLRLMEEDWSAGYVISHPLPTPYAIKDPLHDPREMAVILSVQWRLPDPLKGAVTPPAGDGPREVQLLY